MTSIFQTSPSPTTTKEMEIPQEILKKAAESALISSFVDLNLHSSSPSNGTFITRGRKVSPPSSHNPKSKHQSNKVIIEIEMSSSQATTSIFVKSIPPLAPRALKEVQVYSSLIKELYPKDKSKFFLKTLPDCYLTHEGMIFLENLKVSGFKSCAAEDLDFDFNHALLSIQTLARFHAQSFFLLRQLGGKVKGRLGLLKKFPFLKEQTSNNSSFSVYSQVCSNFFEQIILKIVEAENPSLAFKLRRKYQDFGDIYRKREEILENEKYDNDDFYVICHGDFRPDNLLFKYGTNGMGVEPEPEECRIVDLKNVKLAPLASDLVFFMLTSMGEQMREDFEEKLVAFYCDSFEDQLSLRYRQEGLELKENDFNIEEFHRKVEDQYKRMLEFGFYCCVTALPLLSTGLCSVFENLEEIHLDSSGASVLTTLENSEKFQQLAKECLTSEKLRENVMGVVKRLVKARIF